ncbi:hypothetical protein [Cytobacillus sp. FSL R5-0596]|uniref:hypothetical protein n=1 Tax=Cytobacillus sp. FSL R5-0596 TaxID=2954696 RepID=UPI0030F5B4E3
MVKIIIYGTTQFSIMLHKLVKREKVAEVVAYTINEKYMQNNAEHVQLEGLPVIAFEQLNDVYPPSKYKILNTIGYTKMNNLRKDKTEECLKKGYEMYSFVSKDATVFSEINNNNANIVLPGAMIGYDVNLGKNNVVYTSCVLTHDINVGNNTFLAAGCTVGGNVSIGNNCFIGMNSTIKNRINIADYTLIGASTYISKDTEKYGVYVPERSIKLEKFSIDIW